MRLFEGGEYDTSRRGQAMLEFLVVLPVLLLLFLATAEISRLFVISGKTEVAARYAALRLFRPENTPPTRTGNSHNYYFEDEFNPENPESMTDQQIARRLNDIFFEGVLDDPDDVVEDTRYYEFEPGDANGAFDWNNPWITDLIMQIIIASMRGNEQAFPIRGNRVTFEYNPPFFPHSEEHSYWDFKGSTGQSGWEDPDPLADYPLYTAKGDFVMVAPTFAGDTGDFLRAMESFGLIVSAQLALWQILILLGALGFG